MSKNTMIVDPWKVKRCSNTWWIVKLWSMWSIWVHRWAKEDGHQVAHRELERLKLALARNNWGTAYKANNRSSFQNNRNRDHTELLVVLHSGTNNRLWHSCLLPKPWRHPALLYVRGRVAFDTKFPWLNLRCNLLVRTLRQQKRLVYQSESYLLCMIV